MGTRLPRKENFARLEVWYVADWASQHTKRRSHMGDFLSINSGPVACTSRLQTSVSMSTSEAEFTALADTLRNTSWVRAVLTDLGRPQNVPTVANKDNLGAIAWTEEIQGLQNVKHIGIRFHFVREMVSKRSVVIKYTTSQDHRADRFMKVLIGQLFQSHRDHIGVINTKPQSDAKEMC